MRTSAALLILFAYSLPSEAAALGYYRMPALHKDTLVFVAEGDLWKVPAAGGNALRLTTHAGEESLPAISPDGKTLAFVAQYEGPSEVYTMPLAGGQPVRRTWNAGRITFVGWTPEGRLLVSTDAYATKPAQQLVVLDISKERKTLAQRVPLAQAADGCYDRDGKTLFFTRLPHQGSHTKRYKGGTAQNLWSFTNGEDEAKPLTADFKGTSKNPMCWQGRVYFVSDRDGSMNLWSMTPDGGDLKQHTKHAGWDVATPSLSEGRIAYQLGADIHLFDIAGGNDRAVTIHLDSDFDQTREHWVKNPAEYLASAHLSPDGSRVALTARGRVFVAPAKEGRFVDAGKPAGVRYRDAGFLDGNSVLTLSDESGEVELWKLPANGVGAAEQLTKGGDVLRWQAVASPDGKRVAHHDKNQRLFILDVEKKEDRKVDESTVDDFEGLAWSPDNKWLAYAERTENSFRRIKLLNVAEGKAQFVTSDRYDSYSPAWGAGGKWLYFLSDRNLRTIVPSPWGTYQPEPFLDKKTKLYQLALIEGLRSPFAPPDELHGAGKEPAKKEGEGKGVALRINFDGIEQRLSEVPAPPGNYRRLAANDRGLFWLSTGRGEGETPSLMTLAIGNENIEVKTVQGGVSFFELSRDGKKLLLRKGNSLFVVDANPAPADLGKKEVSLGTWALSIVPSDEWRQMFAEAWRLERDYFYDRGMHGVDWPAIRRKYEPLVERVASRAELSDLVAQMVSELAALHIFVRGGDVRKGDEDILPASLGARLSRDEAGGGFRVEHIYQTDPDEPNAKAPLARPEVNVKEGDIIEQVNGTATLSVDEIGRLLRNKTGKQVLLRVKPKGGGAGRDVIVRPISPTAEKDLRYDEWEYTRRLETEEMGKGQIGYVHLRAMGGGNFTEWAKGFYPVYTRQGLIIDVRSNRGGNIDSWIIGRLMRKAWFYWTQRVGRSSLWNMQYAFRGHLVVLCDEFTASDGEAFCEGIKRLGLGTVIGTRTWGGEIWLTSSNVLVDRGVATAAEFGVFGPEGTWLIEGHGVDPDIVVDNLPHATFKGEDAQLKAAIQHLQQKIKEKPVELPPIPKFPRP